MGMRMKSAKDKEAIVMFLRPSTDEAIAAPLRKIQKLLGISESARELNIVYGSYPENEKEIAMLSRSIVQVLVDIASYIDVPAADLAQGSVYAVRRSPEHERLFVPLIAIRCGPLAPENSYVSVKYRNQWFWIEDRDLRSKQIFNFLMFMFSLTETGAGQAAPILTIPAR